MLVMPVCPLAATWLPASTSLLLASISQQHGALKHRRTQRSCQVASGSSTRIVEIVQILLGTLRGVLTRPTAGSLLETPWDGCYMGIKASLPLCLHADRSAQGATTATVPASLLGVPGGHVAAQKQRKRKCFMCFHSQEGRSNLGTCSGVAIVESCPHDQHCTVCPLAPEARAAHLRARLRLPNRFHAPAGRPQL